MDESVLVVYVEPLLVDRRVLFIGEARSGALNRVASVAEDVLAFDTGPDARPARLPNGVIVPFDPYELELLDEPFDVVVITHAALLGRRLGDRLDEIARIVGREGFVVVGLGAKDPELEHEQLWDALAIRFDVVRMAGAAPMHAFAVAELGPTDASGVIVDGSLVTHRPKTRAFIAIAGQTDPKIDGYVLVQVDDPGREARQRAAALEGELKKLADEATTARNAVATARAEFDKARAERDALRDERRRIEREMKELEASHRRAMSSLEEATRSGPSADELRKLEERLAAQAERTQELEAEVERRGRLVRELVEETRERGVAGTIPSESAEAERAIERALRAEAEKTEALFQVDELRAKLADAKRSHGPLTTDERDLSARVGQLSAQLMLSRERELEARGARDIARGENLALVAQTAALETQHREMRDRISSLLDKLSGASSSGSIDSAVVAVTDRIEGLRGECSGLRLRLDSIEGGHFVPPTVSTDESASTTELVRHAEALRLENEALAADLAEAKAALRHANDAAAATRDALVERLQLELAEQERRSREIEERERSLAAEVGRLREAVVDASVSVEATDSMSRRINELERDLRDAIRAAEKAASDAREKGALVASDGDRHAVEIAAERERAAAAEAALAETKKALEDTRALLEDLRATADSGAPAQRRRATDVEGESSEGPSRGPDEERDLLLQSLTGQLEERDDRIRALERRLSGVGPAVGADVESMRGELLDLRERAARLSDELAVERDARRVAESRGATTATTATSMVTRELEKAIQQRTQALEAAEARAEGYERDVKTLRDVFAETRQGLEHLLGAASGGGDPELATRLGELLTLLGRY